MSLKTKFFKFLVARKLRKSFKKFDDKLKQGGYKDKGRGLESPKDESKLLPLLPTLAIVGLAVGDLVFTVKSTTFAQPLFSRIPFGFDDVDAGASSDVSGGYSGSGHSYDYSSIPAPASFPAQADKAATYIKSGYFHTAQGRYYKWGSKSRRLCGAGTVSALQVLGVNVRRVAKAQDLGPSLIEAGYYRVGTYDIPSKGNMRGSFQLGDVLVFSNRNHAEVYIPGVSKSGWVSDFFQEHTNPYRVAVTVTLYRLKEGVMPSESSSNSTPSNSVQASSAQVPSGAQGGSNQSVMSYEVSELSKSTYNQR